MVAQRKRTIWHWRRACVLLHKSHYAPRLCQIFFCCQNCMNLCLRPPPRARAPTDWRFVDLERRTWAPFLLGRPGRPRSSPRRRSCTKFLQRSSWTMSCQTFLRHFKVGNLRLMACEVSCSRSCFKAIMGYEAPVVKPPAEYKGDFFKGIYITSFIFSIMKTNWVQEYINY